MAGSLEAMRGSIMVISGCMFSGKTTELLDRIGRFPEGSVAVFKHAIDDRYGRDAVSTHDGKTRSALPIENGAEMLGLLNPGHRIVAIDEAHFFDDSLVVTLRQLSHRQVGVLLTALDRDCWARPFPQVKAWMALGAIRVTRNGVCARCGAVADRTQRLTPIEDGRLVGGAEAYEPRCQRCWWPPPASGELRERPDRPQVLPEMKRALHCDFGDPCDDGS